MFDLVADYICVLETITFEKMADACMAVIIYDCNIL